MNTYNGFTKNDQFSKPDITCDCLCVLQEKEYGCVYYGVREFNEVLNGFLVEHESEEVIAWNDLENCEIVYTMLKSEQGVQECDTSKAENRDKS